MKLEKCEGRVLEPLLESPGFPVEPFPPEPISFPVGGVAPEEMGRRREGEVTVEVQMEPIAPPPVPSRRPKVSSTRSSKRFPRSPGVKLTPLTVSDDAEAIEAVAEVSL